MKQNCELTFFSSRPHHVEQVSLHKLFELWPQANFGFMSGSGTIAATTTAAATTAMTAAVPTTKAAATYCAATTSRTAQ